MYLFYSDPLSVESTSTSHISPKTTITTASLGKFNQSHVSSLSSSPLKRPKIDGMCIRSAQWVISIALFIEGNNLANLVGMPIKVNFSLWWVQLGVVCYAGTIL